MQQFSTWMFTQRPLLLQKLAQIFLCKQWIEIGRAFGQTAFDAVSVVLKKSFFKGAMVVVVLLGKRYQFMKHFTQAFLITKSKTIKWVFAILALFLLSFEQGIGQTNIVSYINTTASFTATGWTGTNNVAANPLTQTNYLLVEAGSPSDLITTGNYDLSSYSYVVLNVQVASYGSGTFGALKIEVSSATGTTFTPLASTYTSATTTGTTYLAGGPIVIPAPSGGFTSTTKFRFSNSITSGRGVRIKSLNIVAPSQASGITFSSIGTTGYTLNWTNGSNGSTGRRVVFVNQTTTGSPMPVNGTIYTASTDWNSKGTQIGATGWYCVYNNTGEHLAGIPLTNLASGTTYRVIVCENEGNGATSVYNLVTATNNPNNQATAAAGPSTDANLSAFTTTASGFTPAFAAATFVYDATVPFATTTATVTATRNQAAATLQVQVNGGGYTSLANATASGALSLNVGANTIDVRVTAEDASTQKTYTLTVTRAAAVTNANLSALTTAASSFSPAFTSGTIAYTASVLSGVSSTTVTPTKTDAGATIQVQVNGGGYASVASGSASSALPLNVGSNAIDVLVTAEDGSTTKIYTITVTRAAATSPTLNAVTLNSALSTTYGTASSGVSFTASGSNLTGNITATAQTGYLVSSDNSTYTSSVSVASGTTVYVAFSSTRAAGSYNGATAVVLSNTSASDVNVTTSALSNTVSQKVLTVTGLTAVNKEYNGLTTATTTGTAALSGLVNSDVVSLSGTPSFNFSSAAVGNAKAITTTNYTLTGAGSGNYSLTQPSFSADIAVRSLTITASNVSKVAGVALSGGAGSTAFSSSGLQNSETIGSVTIVYGTAGAATGDGNTAGVYASQVTPSAATAGTFTASNYSISYVAGSITVTAAPVTIAIQDFETSAATPTWSYSGGGATNATTNKFNGSSSYRISGSQTLTMDNINISSYTSVSLGVAYAGSGPDSGEDLYMDISYDNGLTWVGSGSVKLVDGFSNTNLDINTINLSGPTTQASNPWPTSIASSETQISVRFRINAASASSEYYWIDDVKVTGTAIPTAPILTTPLVSSISTTSATLGANITLDGGTSVTARGTVWGTAAAPTGNSLAEGGTSIAAFSHARIGLTANTLYYYRGYAINTNGTGYSPDGTFTTLALAPTIGSGSSATSSSFTANWSAPTMGSASFTYTVEVDNDNTFGSIDATVSSIASSNISTTIMGLSAGTIYYYRVRAVNAGGNSAWSETSVGIATLAATVSDAPTIGLAVAGVTTATVAYTAPTSNGGSTILSYTATSNPDGITGTLTQAGSGTITVNGLTNGTTYTFTVTATNALGTSAASAASNSVTPNITYCPSTGPASQGSDYFTDFSTIGGTANITNSSSGFSSNGYGNFIVQTVTQVQGGTINYSATSPGIGNGSTFSIFVDWNQDGDFSDAGEEVVALGASPQITSNPSGNFTVPVGATLGNTRMRIIIKDAVGTISACNTALANSETEDYTLNVTTAATSPTLTAAVSATVDAPFNVTFVDDATWRAAINSITVGGTALSPSAYSTTTAGQITFSPTNSALLQSSGSKSIVVIATGYANATVTQSIGFGAATKLGITTQPTAPASNGAVLAAQPVVAIQDQYGNTVTTDNSTIVSAAVSAGSWTLGGTAVISASSGTANFSGLTATSSAAVSGATINFSSTPLTGVSSGTFNIAAPDYLSIGALGTSVTQNFDVMAATTAIPSGFGIHDGNTSTVSLSVGTEASSGSPTSGTSYNWGQSAAERSLGLMFSGSYSSKSVIVKLRNNTGSSVNSFVIGFDYEQYRRNTSAAQTFNLQYSTALTTGWVDVTGGDFTNIETGSSSYGYGTLIASQTFSNLIYTPAVSISSGSDVYFRWILDGSSNSKGVGIDNFSIKGCGILPNTSNLSASGASTIAGNGALVTVTSSSLADGNYTVNYNVSGTNTVASTTASMTFTSGTGNFTTSTLSNTGNANVVNITSIAFASVSGCTSTVSTSTTAFNTVSTAVAYSNTQFTSDRNITRGTTELPIYRFQVDVTNADAVLSNVTFTTPADGVSSNYVNTDITNFKAFLTTSTVFNNSTQLGSTSPSGKVQSNLGETGIAFTGLNATLSYTTQTYYIWLTADVLSGANSGRNIIVNAPTINITGTVAGTNNATGKQSIIGGTPVNYYLQDPIAGTASNWNTDPAGTGINLSSLTAVDVNLIVDNETNATITGDIALGDNSKITVSQGTAAKLTLSNCAITGTIDVGTAGTLELNQSIGQLSVLTLGTLSTGSTVEYTKTAAQTVKIKTYHNLTLGGASEKSAAGNLGVNGSLNINSGSTLNMGSYALSGTLTTSTGSGTLRTQNTSGASIPAGLTVAGLLLLDGSAAQTLVGGTYANITTNNAAGVTTSNDVTVSELLTLTSGIIETGSNRIILAATGSVTRTSGHIYGNIRRYAPTGSVTAFLLPIGDAVNYSPVSIDFAGSVSGTGYLDAVVAIPNVAPEVASGISQTKYVNRKWTLTNTGITGFTSYAPTFTFVAGDIQGAGDPTAFVIRNFASSTWNTTTLGSALATTTSATGQTNFTDFVLGEKTELSVSTQPSAITICHGSNITFTAGSSSSPTPTVQWQRDAGAGFVNITANLDAGTTYGGFNSNTLTLTSPAVSLNGYQYKAVYTNINGSVTSNPATATVNPRPTAVLTGTQAICAGTTSSAISVAFTGTQPWNLTYTDGTTPVTVSGISSSPYTFTVSPTATTTYTVAALSDVNCTAQAGDLTGSAVVTVNSIPAVPTGTAVQNFCLSTSPAVADLSAVGTAITWYDAATSGSIVTSGTALVTNTHYYATQTVSGCESSSRLDVTAVLNANGTWIGGTSGVWNAAANWCGGVPTSGANILFSPSAVNDLLLDQDRSVGNIDFNGSSKSILLGAFHLTATGFSTTSANSYVKTTGSGKLSATILNGATFIFPVGNTSYNALSIKNTTGSADVFSVGVQDVVYLNGVSGTTIATAHVKRTWDISKTNLNAGTGVDLQFNWNSADVYGSLVDPRMNHHTGSAWEIPTSTIISSTPGSNALTVVGYTGTFSPFAVGEGSSPLPVELVSFQANCIEQGVALTWQTASEHSSAYFEVERSVDNQNWNVLENIQAAGNSTSLLTYSIVDPELERTAVYYRLKQVDFDGAYKRYDPISIQCSGLENAILTYPNPSSDEGFQLLYGNALCERTVGLNILDARGNLLYAKTLHLQTGVNVLNIYDFEAETGIYFLQIQEEGKTSAVLKHMHNSMK